MKNLPIILFTLFAVGYMIWHLGRWYEYDQLTKSYTQACAEAYLDGKAEGYSYARTEVVSAYNMGYVSGQSYAYDNVVLCGASPEKEGVSITQALSNLGVEKSMADICVE